MKQIENYIMIRSECPNTFAGRVMNHVKMGYQPIGDMQIVQPHSKHTIAYFVQPMAKYKEEPVEPRLNRADIFIQVSGDYLAENFPQNYESLKRKEVLKFIEDNKCIAYEDESPEFLLDTICRVAGDMIKELENKGVNFNEYS